MGCGLLFPVGARVEAAGVVENLPKPQRSLWACASLPGRTSTLFVSWHAPNAAGDGRQTKMAAYREMTDWLADQDGSTPIVLGADLNTWRDPVPLLPADTGDDWYEEHHFVGADPRHRLNDA
jgi:hypothetical protein